LSVQSSDPASTGSIADLVEELTGRKVLAFLSDNHLDPDVAVESFVLSPRGDGESSANSVNS
jgi:hypothetical protein